MASVSHQPPPESTPLNSTPITQLIAHILAFEGWLIDLSLGTPGTTVDGLDPKDVDRAARRHLALIREHLIQREFTVEVGR